MCSHVCVLISTIHQDIHEAPSAQGMTWLEKKIQPRRLCAQPCLLSARRVLLIVAKVRVCLQKLMFVPASAACTQIQVCVRKSGPDMPTASRSECVFLCHLVAASSTAAFSKPLECTAGDSSSTFAEINTEFVKALHSSINVPLLSGVLCALAPQPICCCGRGCYLT